MVVVKLVCGQDVRRFKSEKDSWNEVYLHVERFHGVNSKVRYMDEDKDFVLIDSQEEFEEALKFKTGATLRLLVEKSANVIHIPEEAAFESASVCAKSETLEEKKPEKDATETLKSTTDIVSEEKELESTGAIAESQQDSLPGTKETVDNSNEQTKNEEVGVTEKNFLINKNLAGLSLLHFGVTCDDCGQSPIRGSRYKCIKCTNYDLCENCEQQNRHDVSHFMLKMKVPGGLGSGGNSYGAPIFGEFLPPHNYFRMPPPPTGPAMFAAPPPVPYGHCPAWYCPPGFCDSMMSTNGTRYAGVRNGGRTTFTSRHTQKEPKFEKTNASFGEKEIIIDNFKKNQSNYVDLTAASK